MAGNRRSFAPPLLPITSGGITRLLPNPAYGRRGAYLDVFSVVELDECFHAGHRMTRKECVEKRNECFNVIRSLGMIISSEEPLDWSASTLDLVHHAPHALSPNIDKGTARGIPVPLYNLVYHDCMVIPWNLSEKGGWGIPDSDSGFLYALLGGGTGYLDIDAGPAEIARANVVLALHRAVAAMRMTRHEFVGGNYRKQRTDFENGVTVEVDFDTGEYSITDGEGRSLTAR